jgi:hypothetical protein
VSVLTLAETTDLIEDAPLEVSDAVLVSMAKSGDTDAFAELCNRHSGKVAGGLSNHQKSARC